MTTVLTDIPLDQLHDSPYQTDKARSAGRGQIGAADEPERDTRTADLFDTAAA